LFDAEIVCLDEQGRPSFQDVIRRVQQTSDSGIARARAKHPAVCYVFDCLYLDGRPIVNDPLIRRREWVVDSIRPNTIYRVSDVVSEGVALYEAASKMGLEGIIAKRKDSVYTPGKRTSHWCKIKTRQTTDCVIIGYTQGKGDRETTFGALHLGRYRDGRLVYVGKVGTGLDQRGLESMFENLRKLEPIPRPIEEKPLDDAVSVWVEPQLVAEVGYTSRTESKYLRFPVFYRLRPDKTPDDCVE
jgi:ATP-dependent DNA ligase